MNTHVVTKALSGPNGQLEPGTEVDASEWSNAPLLVSQRYLKPLDAVAEPDGQTQPSVTFEEKVVAVIKKNLSEGGELAQLLRGLLEQAPAQRSSARRN